MRLDNTSYRANSDDSTFPVIDKIALHRLDDV
jgi:hypothetical protein